MSVVRYVRISEIRHRSDARPLDERIVSALTDSIKHVGLRNPINVRVVKDGYELVAGSHRLAACELLGETEILAAEFVDDDIHAELASIDENLCRADLSPSERAQQTARRKAIYELLHPEAKAGTAGAIASNAVQGNAMANLATASFATSTAAISGQSARLVRRDAERGEKVTDAVMALVKGTRLDTGSYLDKLKNLTAADQMRAAKRDLRQRRMRASRPTRHGGIASRVVAKSTGEVAAANLHERLIALLDEVAAQNVDDIVAACPARERAALCTRLGHLIDVFQRVMERVS